MKNNDVVLLLYIAISNLKTHYNEKIAYNKESRDSYYNNISSNR